MILRQNNLSSCGEKLFCLPIILPKVLEGKNPERTIHVLALAILAVVFGWSGLHKIIDPEGFSLSVFRYHLLPYGFVNIAALWIAGLELVCVAGLFVPRMRTAALWMLLGLLIVFTLGISINLARGSHMACGCFSTSPMAHPVGGFGVLKNMGLMMVASGALIGQSVWRG